jgi:hypothetical protein
MAKKVVRDKGNTSVKAFTGRWSRRGGRTDMKYLGNWIIYGRGTKDILLVVRVVKGEALDGTVARQQE